MDVNTFNNIKINLDILINKIDNIIITSYNDVHLIILFIEGYSFIISNVNNNFFSISDMFINNLLDILSCKFISVFNNKLTDPIFYNKIILLCNNSNISLSFLYFRLHIANNIPNLLLLVLKNDIISNIEKYYKYLIKNYLYSIITFTKNDVDDIIFIGNRNKIFIKYFISKLYKVRTANIFYDLFVDHFFS